MADKKRLVIVNPAKRITHHAKPKTVRKIQRNPRKMIIKRGQPIRRIKKNPNVTGKGIFDTVKHGLFSAGGGVGAEYFTKYTFDSLLPSSSKIARSLFKVVTGVAVVELFKDTFDAAEAIGDGAVTTGMYEIFDNYINTTTVSSNLAGVTNGIKLAGIEPNQNLIIKPFNFTKSDCGCNNTMTLPNNTQTPQTPQIAGVMQASSQPVLLGRATPRRRGVR